MTFSIIIVLAALGALVLIAAGIRQENRHNVIMGVSLMIVSMLFAGVASDVIKLDSVPYIQNSTNS